MRRVPLGLAILHKAKSEPYHISNSLRGVRRASELGANALDVDVNLTRDGVVVATHWSRPLRFDGFRDPQGRIGIDRHVSSMTLAQVMRLRAGNGYRIWPVSELMHTAKAHGITLCLEAKTDKRFNNVAPWLDVLADANRLSLPVLVMSTPRNRGIRRLAAAKAAGLPTMLLTRGPALPWQWRHLDMVKGPRAWCVGKPTRVHRLGVGPKDATRYGAGCHPGNIAAVVAACRKAALR